MCVRVCVRRCVCVRVCMYVCVYVCGCAYVCIYVVRAGVVLRVGGGGIVFLRRVGVDFSIIFFSSRGGRVMG